MGRRGWRESWKIGRLEGCMKSKLGRSEEITAERLIDGREEKYEIWWTVDVVD